MDNKEELLTKEEYIQRIVDMLNKLNTDKLLYFYILIKGIIKG